MKKIYFFVIGFAFLALSCNKNDTKQKELELKQKELELKSKELDIEKTKLTKISFDTLKVSNNLQNEEVKVNYEFNNGTPGIIKNIFRRDGVTYATVDFVQTKWKPGTINDFYVINDNKKLRTFIINNGTVVYDCLTNHKLIYKDIYNDRNRLINYDNNVPFIFSTENGGITELNILCYN